MVRVAAASQQHYGVTMVRGLERKEELKPVSPAALPPEVAAEIQRVGTGPDPAAAIARAAIFETRGLPANAIAEYQAAAKEWPDAVWLKGKAFELSEQIAESARKASDEQAGGETYALLVGISKYQKLPQDLWLQFANADATVMSKLLLSPRGGSVPAKNIFRANGRKCHHSFHPQCLQSILNSRMAKNDTIILFFAGHGTVEVPGSKGAFILTYDSDPQDLSSTAMPMVEIQDSIQKLAQRARVITLVDVCRSGTIGSIRSSSVNSVVERLGESEGEMLGLMASRPKELSYEGPQFGGGHGAFSYFLLKGLAGDADKDKDGIVNVNELIEYVRDKVAQATNDKQHPRDFGNIGNTVALSDVRKAGIEIARLFYPRIWQRAGEPIQFASSQAPAMPRPSRNWRSTRLLLQPVDYCRINRATRSAS